MATCSEAGGIKTWLWHSTPRNESVYLQRAHGHEVLLMRWCGRARSFRQCVEMILHKGKSALLVDIQVLQSFFGFSLGEPIHPHIPDEFGFAAQSAATTTIFPRKWLQRSIFGFAHDGQMAHATVRSRGHTRSLELTNMNTNSHIIFD